MDANALKSSFLRYLEAKSPSKITIRHFPNLILDIAIKATMGNTLNGKPFAEALEPAPLYSFIYQEWKMNYRVILRAYSENSFLNMTFGDAGITPKNIVDHRLAFEELFSQIDGLTIFTEINLFEQLSQSYEKLLFHL